MSSRVYFVNCTLNFIAVYYKFRRLAGPPTYDDQVRNNMIIIIIHVNYDD